MTWLREFVEKHVGAVASAVQCDAFFTETDVLIVGAPGNLGEVYEKLGAKARDEGREVRGTGTCAAVLPLKL